MNFMVVWRQIAEDELAEIWMNSTNRNAVTAAAHAIDQALAIDADAVGRPVFDTVREYIHPPLGVEFEVIVADARVWVLKFGTPRRDDRLHQVTKSASALAGSIADCRERVV